MPDITVRSASMEDLEAVVEITNHYIRHSLCIMKERDERVEERRDWLLNHGDRYPLMVAVRGDEVVGWGSLTPHSERSAYRFTVHDSVYVREDLRGQGVGSAILMSLIATARGLGYHSVVAVIGAAQPASLALHHKFGFQDAGHLKEAGFKFGQWVDVVDLQLRL